MCSFIFFIFRILYLLIVFFEIEERIGDMDISIKIFKYNISCLKYLYI